MTVKIQKIAIYPGTFDPITFGHLDIIQRAAKIVDLVIVAVAKDNAKKPLFSLEERKQMVEEEFKNTNLKEKVIVETFEGLLINFAQEKKAQIIIRGLRAVSDFEYEFQMSGMNAKLNANIQTIFLPAAEKHHFVASKLVKEIARLGGDVSQFVSFNTLTKLQNKLQKSDK